MNNLFVDFKVENSWLRENLSQSEMKSSEKGVPFCVSNKSNKRVDKLEGGDAIISKINDITQLRSNNSFDTSIPSDIFRSFCQANG